MDKFSIMTVDTRVAPQSGGSGRTWGGECMLQVSHSPPNTWMVEKKVTGMKQILDTG